MRDPRNLFDIRLDGHVLPSVTSARARGRACFRARSRDLAASWRPMVSKVGLR